MPESFPLPNPGHRSAGGAATVWRIGGRVLRWLASPQLAVLCFILIAAGALWIAEGGGSPTTAMLAPLSLLMLNLSASIATNPRFRTDLPLLVFHLALAALVILLLVARLTYVDGVVPITRGSVFNGALVQVDKGPWHGDGLQTLRFSNEGFIDEYPANGNQYLTYNQVRWWDAQGQSHVAEIGDDRPLILNGYRIYATRKGLAPRLLWERTTGEMEFAATQLGSLEPDGWFEGYSWQLPGGPSVWVTMHHQFEKPGPGARRVDLGVNSITSPLVMRVDNVRHELRPGQSLALAGGTLTYSRLDAWMGYRVVYDPTMPWSIVTVAIAIASLIWFYFKRIFRRSKSETPP